MTPLLPNRYYRAPIGFGPSPSPRQSPSGTRFGWSAATTATSGVVLQVSLDSVQCLLPDGYVVSPSLPTATVLLEAMELRNLPWLAGRGYNTFGIYFNDVVCNRVFPPVTVPYLAVLFENFTDPITTGREELGFPKAYADIPDAIPREPTIDKEECAAVHALSWQGFEFLRLELNQLQSQPVGDSPAWRQGDRPYTHPVKSGILHQRYIPAVGEPGKADADYATFHPPAPATVKPNMLEFKTTIPLTKSESERVPWLHTTEQGKARTAGEGKYEFLQGIVKLTINKASFEQLPTLYNVVEGLAGLEIIACREVAVQVFQGASDLAGIKRIEK